MDYTQLLLLLNLLAVISLTIMIVYWGQTVSSAYKSNAMHMKHLSKFFDQIEWESIERHGEGKKTKIYFLKEDEAKRIKLHG